MADVKLGQLLDESAQRDAVHVAIAPVIAGECVYPGQHVALKDGKAFIAGDKVGIVDPFLTHLVIPDQRFYLFLYPNTVTSLRHEWTHPAFGPVIHDPKEASLTWLKGVAESCGLSYSSMMEKAQDFLDTGDVFTQYGEERARDTIYSVGSSEFWKHFEIVTGRLVENKDEVPFSCSC